MKVAFNTAPLTNENKLRGIGYYTKNLLDNLKKRIEVIEYSNEGPSPDADIVHYPWFDLFFHTLPVVKSKPTVVTIHDVIPLIFPRHYPIGLKGKVNFNLQKISLKSCHAVITDSQVSKKDISKFLKYPEQKIHVIPLAADEKFRKIPSKNSLVVKKKLNLPDKFLLYVGDVNFVKNIPYLINEFGKLISNSKFNNYYLVLVGNSFTKEVENYHLELQPLIEINKLIDKVGQIIRLGFLDTDELMAVYNLAAVYIQPSLYEGFGLPVIEAQACGCPVISSNKGSLPEVGDDAVIYFNPEKEGELASSLMKLLVNDKLKKALINKGLQQAKNYSWEKVAEQTIEVYEKVINRS